MVKRSFQEKEQPVLVHGKVITGTESVTTSILRKRKMENSIQLLSKRYQEKLDSGKRSPTKDSKLVKGQLIDAAICHVTAAASAQNDPRAVSAINEIWSEAGFKGSPPKPGSGKIKNLVNAAALICSEIDRLIAAPPEAAAPEKAEAKKSGDGVLTGYKASADSLLGLGFKPIVDGGNILWIHDCGVCHTNDDGVWTYMGASMKPFDNETELKEFVGLYEAMGPAGKALNEMMKVTASMAR